MREFETWTASRSKLFSLITHLHTITFTLLSTFSPLGMISTRMWETPMSWHAKYSLLVAVHVLPVCGQAAWCLEGFRIVFVSAVGLC